MNKREKDMLEKVFVAEIEGRLPFQSKSRLAKKLCDDGYLIHDVTSLPADRLGSVKVSGYWLSHKGRLAYCASCSGVDA